MHRSLAPTLTTAITMLTRLFFGLSVSIPGRCDIAATRSDSWETPWLKPENCSVVNQNIDNKRMLTVSEEVQWRLEPAYSYLR